MSGNSASTLRPGDRYAPCRELLRAMAVAALEEQERRPVPVLDRQTRVCLQAALALDPGLAPRVRRVVLRAVLFARALLREPGAVGAFFAAMAGRPGDGP